MKESYVFPECTEIQIVNEGQLLDQSGGDGGMEEGGEV